jgi:hypothetical protein
MKKSESRIWFFLKNLIVVSIPAVLLLFIILEIFFRYVIVASDPPRTFFYENDKIYAYNNNRSDGIYSKGRFAEIKTRWHINNYGWNYPIDYYTKRDSNLVAIIGDSYVEAFQVDVDKNFSFLLRNKLSPRNDVYAFGISGAPLSQYLHISRYVNKKFNPDVLIFNLVHNDFDESLFEYYPQKKYFMQLYQDSVNGGFLEKQPEPDYSRAQYRPLWQKIVYKSAFIRYLYLNLEVNNMLKKSVSSPDDVHFEANTFTDELNQREKIIKLSTEYLVKTIKDENKERKIIFVFDAPRQAIYNNSLSKSDVVFLNEMMKELCDIYKIDYLDLTEPMQKSYNKNRRKFNSEYDDHWDEYGNEFVANEIYNFLSSRIK